MHRQIILGKCEEELFKLPAGQVALVCTSPPYNVGIAYDTHNDNMLEADYYKWVEQWIKGCFHVLMDGGRIAINLPNVGNNSLSKGLGLQTYLDKYIPILKASGFTLRECITWVKTHDPSDPEHSFCGSSTAWGSWKSPNNPYCRSFSEVILVAHKNRAERGVEGESDFDETGDEGEDQRRADEFTQATKNVWYMPAETDRTHPAPFPVDLPSRLIKFYTYKNEIVLDPFGGSGTTGLAAESLGRGWIIMDVSPAYLHLAEKRINHVRYQTKLEGFS